MDPTPNDGLTDPAARLDDPRAEEVRAHLALLRGGAPFLSATDGRLLVRWLEGGVPVVLILSALDRAAERRQRAARPARGRLGLGSVRAAVDKAVGAAVAAEPGPAIAAARGAWQDWCAAVVGIAVAPADRPAHAALVAAVQAVPADAPTDARLHAAVTAVRHFHSALSAADAARLGALQAAAAAALAPLAAALPPDDFAELVQESVAGQLRAIYPAASTAPLRDALLGGPA